MHFLKKDHRYLPAIKRFTSISVTALAIAASASSCASQPEEQNTSTTNTETKRPLHHTEDGFRNPYLPEGLKPSLIRFMKARLFDDLTWPDEPENHTAFWQEADKALISAPDNSAPQATLIGHSTVLIQYQGINILTDPVFSDHAFPFQFAGPERYTPPALNPEDLPPIDIVVISHNHYDHLDSDTVETLGNKPLWLVPLGLKEWFLDSDITNVQELDWWESYTYGSVEITATPSQHWSRRSLFDTNKSLWASWAFKWNDFTAWFGGDTGYNTRQFREIGDYLGKVDLAMIPIGAYEPRWFMKNQHVNPSDSVEIFKDIKAESAFGIHWNTFVLTAEPVDEPPAALKQAMQASMLDPGTFTAMPIGKTWMKKNELLSAETPHM